MSEQDVRRQAVEEAKEEILAQLRRIVEDWKRDFDDAE